MAATYPSWRWKYQRVSIAAKCKVRSAHAVPVLVLVSVDLLFFVSLVSFSPPVASVSLVPSLVFVSLDFASFSTASERSLKYSLSPSLVAFMAALASVTILMTPNCTSTPQLLPSSALGMDMRIMRSNFCRSEFRSTTASWTLSMMPMMAWLLTDGSEALAAWAAISSRTLSAAVGNSPAFACSRAASFAGKPSSTCIPVSHAAVLKASMAQAIR
mmetsp:Transcript_8417/g.18222  ORF Transcript_8417/g.18222 Transcript_8417/m.18222 type:complete len:215 (+) Transcript_8417:206-850(+)